MSQSNGSAAPSEPDPTRTSSRPDEDWSEIEALLEGTTAPPPAQAAVTRPRYLVLGLMAALTLGGGAIAALSSAANSECRGDRCPASATLLETPSDRPVAAGGAPVRVVSTDAHPAPRDEPPARTGRSVAAPSRPVPVPPRIRRSPAVHAPLVAARGLPNPSRAPATTSIDRRAFQRTAHPATDSAGRSIVVRSRAVARLRRVWVSPSEWILVRAD